MTHEPERPPDIEAEISLLTPEQGGRGTPLHSGFTRDHNFGIERNLNMAEHRYLGQDTLDPGETALANMWFLVPAAQEGRLYSWV